MKIHAARTKHNKRQLITNGQLKHKNSGASAFQLADYRPNASSHKTLQLLIDKSAVAKPLETIQKKADLQVGILQKRGRVHASRVYKVTVSAEWMVAGQLHIEPAETYIYPYTSDDDPTAPLERQAKREYRTAHPNVPNGGPGMRMNVNGRALQG